MSSIVYRLLIGTWSQGNLHYMRLHFLKLDREFFCLQPSLARLYSAAPSPSERLRSDGSLAINNYMQQPERNRLSPRLSTESKYFVSGLQNKLLWLILLTVYLPTFLNL